MHANKREEIASVGAGQIVAVMGLKDTKTGHTLCDPQNPVVLESMTFPAPVISVAIEPKTKGDQEKLGTAIQRLSDEDPTFTVKSDEETGQTIISGMGELHLEILVDRMRREFRVEATVGKPQVAYRETIRNEVANHSYTHKKQTGGSGQFAKVVISPRARTSTPRPATVRATSSSTTCPVAASRASTSRRSTRAARRPWSSACSPATRWSTSSTRSRTAATTTSTPPSSPSSWPASQAFKEAARMAKPVLLEPMFAVEVITPENLPRRRHRRHQLAVVARSSGRRSVTATWSSQPLYRCQRCSGTLAT